MNSSSRECGMNLLNVFLDKFLKRKKNQEIVTKLYTI
jgi:hypothetical protein